MKALDLTNQPFGRLTAKRYAGYCSPGSGRVWECECSCGKKVFVDTHKLRSGNTKSCGCLKLDLLAERSTTYGLRDHPDYGLWYMMNRRCYDESVIGYRKYGGRGIRVCDRWWGPDGFANFLTDMGPRPSPNHSIDRFPDQCGNYFPGNCRWATAKEQSRNTTVNVKVTYRGVTKLLIEWAEELGVDYGALRWRMDNWKDAEKAFNKPYKRRRKIAIARSET